jgi:hypothetical protein
MRVVRNIGYVKRRKRLAKWSAIFGVALLGSTFWLALNPDYVLLAYLPLLIGTLIFHFGMQQFAKWNRNPRNDVILDQRLQALPDKYALIHYPTLGRRPVEHLLVHPGGVLVVTARELPGKVSHHNGRWRKKGSGIGRLFGLGGAQLGNPTFETQQNVAAVQRYLAEAQYEAEVDGVIVFLNPLVELDVEEPDFPVTNAEGLQEYLRGLEADASLATADRQTLVDLLSQGEELEVPQKAQRRRPVKTRRPVKKRAA